MKTQEPQDAFDWLLGQVNPLSILLLVLLLALSFLHGLTVVGICGG